MSKQNTRFTGLTVKKLERLKNGQSHPDDEVIVELYGKQGVVQKTIFLGRLKTKTLRRVICVGVTTATSLGLSWGGYHLGFF